MSIDEESIILIYSNSNETTIKSSNETIKEITVFDVLGRKLFDFQNINHSTFQTNKLITETLLIKITLSSGKVLTKKHIQ